MWVSFIVCVILLIIYTSESGTVSQPDPVMMVSAGENVTLRCLYSQDQRDRIFWYKQTSGKQPHIIAAVEKYVDAVFYNEFKSQQRFSIERAGGVCHLKISNVTASDKGMYYCGLKISEVVFAEGTYLTLKGLQTRPSVSVLQHPVSVSVHTGDTVNLMCSVLSELTSADIRMFWFRSDSGKSVPQIIYTYNQSDQCEIDSATQKCTYNLNKNIISQTDAGMYYCALITCGKILLGNGTKINVEKPVESIVIILGVLLGVCVVVITAQAVSCHKRYYYKGNVQDLKKEHPSSQVCDAMHLHYAASYFKEEKNRGVRRKEAQENVYSQLNDLSVVEYRIIE